MKTTGSPPSFEEFATVFVETYWETARANKFPMPPNEPVEESLENILESISIKTATHSLPGSAVETHTLRMTGDAGSWWEFTFRGTASNWSIIDFTAPSQIPRTPHHLLEPPYDEYFRPFIDHVVSVTHRKMSNNRMQPTIDHSATDPAERDPRPQAGG